MVLMPGALNVVQFWILDNLLKSSAASEQAPDAPLSPSKGVRACVCGACLLARLVGWLVGWAIGWMNGWLCC